MEPTSIEYQVTIEDLVAFNADVRKSSASFRGTIRRTQICMWIAAAAMGSIVFVGARLEGNFMIVVGSVVAIVMAVSSVGLSRRVVKSHEAALRKLYAEGTNPGILGWRRLSLAVDGVLEESEIGHSSTRYSSVQRVSETPDHLFVYIGSLNAHVIPKQRIQSGDLDEFKAALQARLDKR